MGVFSNDFAAVDVREELCYPLPPEKAMRRDRKCLQCRQSDRLKRQSAENENQRVESHARRKKRQPIPKRFSGDGSAPPRLSVWFFRVSFRGVCLAAAGGARRTCLCQAHATVPTIFLFYAILSCFRSVQR